MSDDQDNTDDVSHPEPLDSQRAHRIFPTGALPPPELAWLVGKTVAAIEFVQEAEDLLSRDTLLSADDAAALQAHVNELKAGIISMPPQPTVTEFLNSLDS